MNTSELFVFTTASSANVALRHFISYRLRRKAKQSIENQGDKNLAVNELVIDTLIEKGSQEDQIRNSLKSLRARQLDKGVNQLLMGAFLETMTVDIVWPLSTFAVSLLGCAFALQEKNYERAAYWTIPMLTQVADSVITYHRGKKAVKS